MRVAVAFDHRGVKLRERVLSVVEELGHETVDLGTDAAEPRIDYPDKAREVGDALRSGAAERAVLVCGSGVGVSIVANKVDGVRAVNAHDPDEAEMSRRHNNANVLALAGRRLEEGDAAAIVDRFLATEFEGGRHERRVGQIAQVERGERP